MSRDKPLGVRRTRRGARATLPRCDPAEPDSLGLDISRLTAKEFLAASVFFDVLSIFGPLETEVSRSSKWTAMGCVSVAT